MGNGALIKENCQDVRISISSLVNICIYCLGDRGAWKHLAENVCEPPTHAQWLFWHVSLHKKSLVLKLQIFQRELLVVLLSVLLSSLYYKLLSATCIENIPHHYVTSWLSFRNQNFVSSRHRTVVDKDMQVFWVFLE